jgi:hypothetical protein
MRASASGTSPGRSAPRCRADAIPAWFTFLGCGGIWRVAEDFATFLGCVAAGISRTGLTRSPPVSANGLLCSLDDVVGHVSDGRVYGLVFAEQEFVGHVITSSSLLNVDGLSVLPSSVR